MVFLDCLFVVSKVLQNHSIANSSLFPTFLYLHSNSTQILALKKMFFLKKKSSPPPKKIFFTFFLCNSADAMVFSKKFKKKILAQKKWKNGPQKLLIICPDPFISQSSPDQRPKPQNWFFILRNLGTRHLFSYLWVVGCLIVSTVTKLIFTKESWEHFCNYCIIQSRKFQFLALN